MDTLAHGLWATAAAKANNRFAQRKFRIGWFVFWGVLPDLFSFTPAVAWLVWQVIIEGIPFAFKSETFIDDKKVMEMTVRRSG